MHNQECEHKKWKKAGIWDGVNPNGGGSTGGIMYKCIDCGKMATSLAKIEEFGGEVVEDTDVMGKPKVE